MFGTIMLSLGSFIFTFLLLVVYILKIKEETIGNKIYTWLLVILLFVLGTEIISVYTIYHHEEIPFLNAMLCRMHCLCVLGWVTIMAVYLLSLEKSYDPAEFKNYLFKELKLTKVIFVYIILVIVFFILKLEYVVLPEKNTAYLEGPALYYTYFIGVFVVGMAIYMITKKRNVIKFKKMPILIMIVETIFTLPLSLLLPHIYIITSSFTFKVFVLYFMTEDPDLYAIRKLKKAKESTEASSRAKTKFVSNVTSEIKSPIKTIIGFSESLSNKIELDKEEDLKSIRHIYSASNNLIEIVDNVLELSRIETTSEGIIEETYELKKILSELMSIIGARIDSKVSFRIIVDNNVPSKYKGDRIKIFKILLNLLSNAVKYTEVGKITLKCSYKVENKKSYLSFKVSDTGIGIKEEECQKLIEKFSTVDYSIREEIEGLGLILAKKLVDILDGRIWFDSTYGVGSNFYVELEQKIVDQTPMKSLETECSQNQKIDHIDLSNFTVLLVDDNKLNLKVAEKLLSFYKFNVVSVSGGKEAIRKIKEGNIYDIIFLDHMMPELDGIEVMHILKKLSKNFNVPPIVALTANAITGMREMYLKEGFDDYLSKPINISELDKIIHKYFDKKIGGDAK